MTFGVSRIFKSTDTGAPALTQSVGSMKELLKSVLVNGYGTTPSLGWTLEYESGNIAVFRPKKGTRRFIRVDDSIGSFISGSYYMYSAYVTSYETMNSVNTGTDMLPSGGYVTLLKVFNASGTVKWNIVGDDSGFWIIHNPYDVLTAPSSLGTFAVHYFGDYNVWDIRNKWNFVMVGAYTSSIAHPYFLYPHVPIAAAFNVAARGSSFSRGAVNIGVLPFNNNTVFGENSLCSPSLGIDNNKIGGAFMKSPIHLYETTSNGDVILGSFPGISEPIMKEASATMSAGVSPSHYLWEESTDSDGTSILFRAKAGSNTTTNTVGKLIIRIGKGFRNVQ